MTMWERAMRILMPKRLEPPKHKKDDRDLQEAKRRKQEIMARLINLGVEADVITRRGEGGK